MSLLNASVCKRIAVISSSLLVVLFFSQNCSKGLDNSDADSPQLESVFSSNFGADPYIEEKSNADLQDLEEIETALKKRATSSAGSSEPVSASASQSKCFHSDENAKIPFRVVMRSANTPVDPKTNEVLEQSNSFIGNAFYLHHHSLRAAQSTFRDDRNTTYRPYKGIWANYCTPAGDKPTADCKRTVLPNKGNYISPPLYTSFIENIKTRKVNKKYQVRPTFRSYRNANACTLAQIAGAMGLPGSVIATYIRMGEGLRVFYRDPNDPVKERQLSNKASIRTFKNGVRGKFLKDLCPVEIARNSNPYGIVLDYEVFDKRSPAATLNLVRSIRKLLNRKQMKFVFYTNSIQQSGTRHANGVTEQNIRQIMLSADYFSPIIWSGATRGAHKIPGQKRRWSFMQSLSQTLAVMRKAGAVPYSKFLPTVSLYDLSPKEARQLYGVFRSRNYAGLKTWKNGVKINSNCTNAWANRVIKCLSLGEGNCSSPARLKN